MNVCRSSPTTLLRSIATTRSNGEWLRVSGRSVARSQLRLRVAHEGDGVALGSFPSRVATARRIASERIRRASPVTMAAASTLATATTFAFLTGEQIRIDESLRRILARHQRYDDARERERERDERCDEPSVPHNRRQRVDHQIFIVSPIIRAVEPKTGLFPGSLLTSLWPLLKIELERF